MQEEPRENQSQNQSHNHMHNQGWSREELVSLLSVSGTLAGLSITIVAFMDEQSRSPTTVTDDLLAFCAAIFLACIYLTVWALRTRSPRRTMFLVKIVDALFLLALTGMTIAAFLMVYTIW